MELLVLLSFQLIVVYLLVQHQAILIFFVVMIWARKDVERSVRFLVFPCRNLVISSFLWCPILDVEFVVVLAHIFLHHILLYSDEVFEDVLSLICEGILDILGLVEDFVFILVLILLHGYIVFAV